MLQPLLVPILAVVRFLVLTPLAWASPALRHWVHQRASSMVMDPAYVRPLPTRQELRIWRLQEACCFVYALAAAVQFALGLLPLTLLAHAYLTAVVILLLNNLRTLGAHRFRHRGEPLTFVDQLLDSINYPRRPLISELWAPVGLRFHALHHLFPSIPYHNLGAAHRRLMRQLPPDSPYRRTESPSLLASIRDLWRNAGNSKTKEDEQWRDRSPESNLQPVPAEPKRNSTHRRFGNKSLRGRHSDIKRQPHLKGGAQTRGAGDANAPPVAEDNRLANAQTKTVAADLTPP
jgi:hypothetical protein